MLERGTNLRLSGKMFEWGFGVCVADCEWQNWGRGRMTWGLLKGKKDIREKEGQGVVTVLRRRGS